MNKSLRVLVFGGLLLAGGMAAAEPTEPSPAKPMMGAHHQTVTKEDFMKQAEARFARMDVNHDGVIDATDRKKMHDRMRECMDKTGDKTGVKDKPADHPATYHSAP